MKRISAPKTRVITISTIASQSSHLIASIAKPSSASTTQTTSSATRSHMRLSVLVAPPPSSGCPARAYPGPVTERHAKPVKFAGYQFEAIQGGDDPAAVTRLAHESAAALVTRVREERDPHVVERLVTFTDEHGIDAIAELWSRATPRSLPGALWRIYLVRAMIRSDPGGISLFYKRGIGVAHTIDPVVAGAADPAGPHEVLALADQILRGVFTGDLAVALDRAAAFCRVVAAGCASLADDADAAEPGRATDLTKRASRLSTIAVDLSASSKLWAEGALD